MECNHIKTILPNSEESLRKANQMTRMLRNNFSGHTMVEIHKAMVSALLMHEHELCYSTEVCDKKCLAFDM